MNSLNLKALAEIEINKFGDKKIVYRPVFADKSGSVILSAEKSFGDFKEALGYGLDLCVQVFEAHSDFCDEADRFTARANAVRSSVRA